MCFTFFNPKPKKGPKPPFSSITTPKTPSNNHPLFTPTTTNNHLTSSTSSSSISSSTSLSNLKNTLLPQNPIIYNLPDLRSATNNFLLPPVSSSSSSTSWKSTLRNHPPTLISQRKLRRPLETPDLRQKLSLLCKSHHASLVKLYGASVNGNYIYLVYDYIPGANLNDCLRNPRNPNFTVLSNWLSRVQIAAGIADGVDYMHNCVGIKGGLIHNHIKSSSIVITDEPSLTAKLCHLGVAQLCGEFPEDEDLNSGHRVLKRVGSGLGKFEGARGYMSPEFQATGVATLKSDVFAFGVVVLELLSGEEPVKIKVDQDKDKNIFQKVSLIDTAREAVKGRLRQWVDRRLKDSYPIDVAESLTRVALECVQEDPERRPDMGRVAGWISKLYLESKTWAQSFGTSDDITVSFAPR